MIAPVPTLAEVVADGSKLADLDFRTLWGLLRDLGHLEREITAAMLATGMEDRPAGPPPDQALTIEQAAERLQISPHTTPGSSRARFRPPRPFPLRDGWIAGLSS